MVSSQTSNKKNLFFRSAAGVLARQLEDLLRVQGQTEFNVILLSNNDRLDKVQAMLEQIFSGQINLNFEKVRNTIEAKNKIKQGRCDLCFVDFQVGNIMLKNIFRRAEDQEVDLILISEHQNSSIAKLTCKYDIAEHFVKSELDIDLLTQSIYLIKQLKAKTSPRVFMPEQPSGFFIELDAWTKLSR